VGAFGDFRALERDSEVFEFADDVDDARCSEGDNDPGRTLARETVGV